jgi:O-antigen ligase
MKREAFIRNSGYALFVIFFITVFLSLRAYTGIVLGLILFWAIVAKAIKFQRSPGLAFILVFSLYFLLSFAHTILLPDQNNWTHVLLQAGLLLTALAVYFPMKSSILDKRKIFEILSLVLIAVLLYCLVVNMSEYKSSGDPRVFFYHKLVEPARQHAVYLSIYVLTAIVFNLESAISTTARVRKTLHFISTVVLSIFLILLSSKLVLAFFLLIMLYKLFVLFKTNRVGAIVITAVLLLLVTLALITRNPVSGRFRELFNGNLSSVSADTNNPADYFNGIEFRLLQYRLVYEILNEKNGWMTGTGSKNARQLLDSKYSARNMYQGDPRTGARGYPGYNTHNQFLESLLQFGLMGVVIFSLASVLLIRLLLRSRRSGYILIYLLLFFYCFTEAVLETQYGIVLFSFLPLFLSSQEETF